MGHATILFISRTAFITLFNALYLYQNINCGKINAMNPFAKGMHLISQLFFKNDQGAREI